MTDQQFMDKWRGQVTGWWAENGPGPLFWVRSYKMQPETLVEMSGDFLLLDKVPNCSSREVALSAIWPNATDLGFPTISKESEKSC